MFKFTRVILNTHHLYVIDISVTIMKLLLFHMAIFECICKLLLKKIPKHQISINYSQSTMDPIVKSLEVEL